jgi:hypothetical protein
MDDPEKFSCICNNILRYSLQMQLLAISAPGKRRQKRLMKHELCKIADIPASGKSLIVPFFGRELHVYKTDGRYLRSPTSACISAGRSTAKTVNWFVPGIARPSPWTPAPD